MKPRSSQMLLAEIVHMSGIDDLADAPGHRERGAVERPGGGCTPATVSAAMMAKAWARRVRRGGGRA